MKVYILVRQKHWLDWKGECTENAYFAFDTFTAANRAMYKDWNAVYDNARDDADRFLEDQTAPSKMASEATLEVKDDSRTEWHIHVCEVKRESEVLLSFSSDIEERGRLMEGPVAVLVKGQFTEWYSPFYHDPVYGIREEDDSSDAAQALADEGIIGPTLGDYMLCDDVGWLAERQCSMITGSYPEWERETKDLIVQIEAAFILDKPRTYHSDKCGDFEIIPYHAEEMPPLSEKSLKFYGDLGYGEQLKEAVGKMLKGD